MSNTIIFINEHPDDLSPHMFYRNGWHPITHRLIEDPVYRKELCEQSEYKFGWVVTLKTSKPQN